jgi:hypothetical protein
MNRISLGRLELIAAVLAVGFMIVPLIPYAFRG